MIFGQKNSPINLLMWQGRSQDFTLEGTEAERQRRENREVGIGRGCPPPNLTS